MAAQPAVTVYHTPMSSSTRVAWALEELGLSYEKKRVDLAKGEQRTPEFLKLNPNGKVPVLVIDGKPMFESIAMILYLGETFGVDKGLFPAPGTDRAIAFQWMVWAGVTLNEALQRYSRNTNERYPADQKNEAAAKAAHADLQKLVGILEQSLDGREYLVGPSFTLADLTVSSWIGYLGRQGFDLSPYARVNAWQARCSSRPAMKRAAEA